MVKASLIFCLRAMSAGTRVSSKCPRGYGRQAPCPTRIIRDPQRSFGQAGDGGRSWDIPARTTSHMCRDCIRLRRITMRRMLRKNNCSKVGGLVSMIVMGLFALGAGCASAPPDRTTGTASAALTGDQCMSFDVNGKDTICHHTGSAQHPFTILKTSQQGCIDGHAQHPQDYVAVGDPTCQGGGCLPQGA